tara:strand:- start:1801 stop:1983 length:183 start_codon:yes stop_codon:yes gene_type:complete
MRKVLNLVWDILGIICMLWLAYKFLFLQELLEWFDYIVAGVGFFFYSVDLIIKTFTKYGK